MLRSPRTLATAARRAAALRNGAANPSLTWAVPAAATAGNRYSKTLITQTRPRREAPILVAVWRTQYSTKNEPPVLPTHSDKKLEEKLAKEKLEKDPAHVSVESSYRQDTAEPSNGERDVSEGVVQDLKTVKETLSLSEVPREAYALGLAGTIPYLATSLSTVYLTWNLRTQWPTDSNFLNSILVSPETAQQWLSHLELIQLGYGAVIISFLGAIHWGLEWAEKKPSEPRTRYRYAVGVVAPAIAWPTLILPAQFALIGQFLAFTGLYFVDSRFTTRGWTPRWYGTYRFVLTAIVGGAIFVSLVFRSKGGEEGSRLSDQSLDETMHGMHGHPAAAEAYSPKWAKLEEEEREKIKKEKEEEEKRKKKEEAERKKKEKKEGKGKKGGKKGDEAKASGEDKGDDSESESDDDNSESEDSDDSDGEDRKEGGDGDNEDGGGDDEKETDGKAGDDNENKDSKKTDDKADQKGDKEKQEKDDQGKGGKKK